MKTQTMDTPCYLSYNHNHAKGGGRKEGGEWTKKKKTGPEGKRGKVLVQAMGQFLDRGAESWAEAISAKSKKKRRNKVKGHLILGERGMSGGGRIIVGGCIWTLLPINPNL